MLGTIVAVFTGPISCIYVLGHGALLLVLPAVVALAVNAGIGVHPGLYTTPDKITTFFVGALVTSYVALLLYMSLWYKIEAYFSYTPWLRYNGRVAVVEGGRKYATRCPFTGQRPNMRCNSCDARVHESAFHKSDPLIALPFGETVLRWDGAKMATEQSGSIRQARRKLDGYLDFKGNTIFATVRDCCTGCATWQRCFNLLPRLSLSMSIAGMFCAFIPWAFASFLGGDNSKITAANMAREQSKSSVIGGGGAKTVHVLSNVLAVMYASAGLLIQIHALLRANDFLEKHRPAIPAFQPLLRSPRNTLLRFIMWAPWHQKV